MTGGTLINIVGERTAVAPTLKSLMRMSYYSYY